ncbi:hypothetical protein BD779DRAFT_1468963 [Infundibulicybe gibba]|nr:hypothetical protein BD779DRAFT_1468963 [Infundibulicybe gibba]
MTLTDKTPSTSLFPRGIPITKLPDELVLMIIQLGEQDSEGLSGDCAILASHVCSHWRNLLLAIPFLWSDVRICNMPSGIPNFGRASAFVARSSPCPIRVTVFAAPLLHFGTASQGTQRVASDISAFIAPHVYRIQQFELYYTQHFQAGDVEMMIPRGPAPLLDSLSVQCMINWTVASLFGTNEPFILPLLQSLHELDDAHEAAESFPNLKRLVLSSIAPTWSYFPLQNLRSLELQNLSTSTQPTWPQLCDVLKANAATLEVLTLDGGLPEGPSSCIPFIMPALTFLHLGYRSPGALEHFVAMIQVPRLTDLLLIDRSGTEEPGETSILASVIEHIPLYQLHTLHLSDIGFMTLEAPQFPPPMVNHSPMNSFAAFVRWKPSHLCDRIHGCWGP